MLQLHVLHASTSCDMRMRCATAVIEEELDVHARLSARRALGTGGCLRRGRLCQVSRSYGIETSHGRLRATSRSCEPTHHLAPACRTCCGSRLDTCLHGSLGRCRGARASAHFHSRYKLEPSRRAQARVPLLRPTPFRPG